MSSNAEKYNYLQIEFIDNVISTTSTMKILGIHIDSKLNFNGHIVFLCTKGGWQLNVLQRTRRSLDYMSRMAIYNSFHYDDVRMGAIASQITCLTIVYSIVYSDADQRKHQSSVSLAFVRGIHRGPVNSPHKWPVTRKMFPFDDVIMIISNFSYCFVVWMFTSKFSLNNLENSERRALIFVCNDSVSNYSELLEICRYQGVRLATLRYIWQ